MLNDLADQPVESRLNDLLAALRLRLNDRLPEERSPPRSCGHRRARPAGRLPNGAEPCRLMVGSQGVLDGLIDGSSMLGWTTQPEELEWRC
jgi:hypothetical protein